jgi:hypothetical protein
MGVDMERLRIERHVGEQHIIHLRDGSRQPVLDHGADDKILVKNTASLVAPGVRIIAHALLSLLLDAAAPGGLKLTLTMLNKTGFENSSEP